MCKELDMFESPQQSIASAQEGKCDIVGGYPCLEGSEQAQRLYSLLCDGHKYSVVDIMSRLYIGDPRSVVRILRNSGIQVLDEWRTAQSGSRYKVYWIEK